jgi:PAS domain-containing protein
VEQIQHALLERGHWEGEVVRRRKDGAELVVALLWALRRDDRGRALAILEVSADVTDRRQAEQALQQSVRRFELLAQPDIDGALVGGASLKVDDFLAIIGAAAEAARKKK